MMIELLSFENVNFNRAVRRFRLHDLTAIKTIQTWRTRHSNIRLFFSLRKSSDSSTVSDVSDEVVLNPLILKKK